MVNSNSRAAAKEQVKQDTGYPLPDFVMKEFNEYLRCGILAHGFLRAQSESCPTWACHQRHQDWLWLGARQRLIKMTCQRKNFSKINLAKCANSGGHGEALSKAAITLQKNKKKSEIQTSTHIAFRKYLNSAPFNQVINCKHAAGTRQKG